jgi:hypothetical protein
LTRSPGARVALGLVAVALGGALAAPTAHGGPPGAATQQVLVPGPGGVATVEVTEAELARLRADPAVGPVVTRGRVVHAQLAESVPKVGAPTLWAGGQRGAGQVIVVIDTGVLPAFGGTLVGQACFAATQEGPVLHGHCGPGEDQRQAFDSTCFDLGVCAVTDGDVLDPAAARPCDAPPADPDDCYHGTAVAAAAARHEPTPGVAPDAGVYAIRVFNPTGTTADILDLMLALEHVRELSDAGLDIVAVNLSVATTNTYPTACDAGPGASDDALVFRALFDDLLARGIANAVASGNSGNVGGVALPACVSSALSVGATDLDDDLADFGNRGPTLDLVAPGVDEGNGTVNRMEIPGSPLGEWAGTSFSAPHVAGAFALLAPQYPKASPGQLEAFLRSTGVPVRDPATGATYPRLRLRAPEHALAAGVLFPTTTALPGAPRSAVGDLDGDGHEDVLAHVPGAPPDRVAYGDDDWRPAVRAYGVAGTYHPLVGQFRGALAGADDILWYAPGAAADALWVGSPARTFASRTVTVNGTYAPLVGDFDGDGYDDVLWYAPGPASDAVWYGGPTGFTSVGASITGSYRTAVGDFDGDGRDDVVFHGPNTASDSIWRSTSTRGAWSNRALSMGGSYTVLAGDVDGDGDHDLVLYQPGSRADSIWRGGPAVGGAGATGGFAPLPIVVNATYQPQLADVDGDGRRDIVWYAPGPAGDHVWLGQPAGAPVSRPIVVNGTYALRAADLDAAAGDELVWLPPGGSTTPVWWSHAPAVDGEG